MSAAETKCHFSEAPSFSLGPATPFFETGAAFGYECYLRRKEVTFLYGYLLTSYE